MKVKWLGHAAFLITSDEGTKIVTDPYQPGMFGLNYGKIDEAADIVTVSHDHADHNYVQGVPGKPQVVKSSGTSKVKGIEFKGIPSFHDEKKGGERGQNTIFCFTVDGIRVCHMGDLGHTLSDREAKEVGSVDIMLIPVAGMYTVDAVAAGKIVDHLKPRVVIPMHFKTEKCPDFPVTDVKPFTAGKTNVKVADKTEVEFKKEQLPKATQIMVLKHTR